MLRQLMTSSRAKFFFFAILALTAVLPVSQWLSVRLLIPIAVFALFVGTREVGVGKYFALAWDSVVYSIILLIGLTYSDDVSTGWRVIETSLSLLVLPLVFSRIESFRKEHLHRLFLAFTIGLCVASLICLVNAVISYTRTTSWNVFFFDNLTRVIDSHPTYLAYYLIVSITYGLYLLHYEQKNYPRWAVLVCVSFLFMILMLTGGTTAFVSMLFVLAFFILKFMLDKKSERQISLLFVVVTLIICMFVFNEVNRGESTRNDSWERLVLWESALKANPNLLFGVGTGDYRNELKAYYVAHDLPEFASLNFNPHNQFLDTYFASGLLGLLSLVVLIARPIYLSMRNGNTLGTLVFFPFIIYGMTEVFFGRYQGVVFFALMQQAFMTFYMSYKPSPSLKRA